MARTRGVALRLLISLLCLLAVGGAQAAEYPYREQHPNRLKLPALEFSPPRPVKRTLPNGLTLYLLEDHDLPLFNAVAYVNVGSIWEPADKVGLAALTGTVMRTGGTAQRTGDEIDEALEFVGGSVETAIGAEYGTARVATLQKDASLGMEILAGVLRQPAFREEKLELAKQQTLEAIRRKNDQPAAIADRVFAQAIYGADSPWAREASLAGVQAITREDLAGFHQRFFAPNNVRLAIAGDMSTEEMVRLVEQWFGDWERRPVELPPTQPVPESVTPEVILVPKEVSQVNLRLGHLGVRRFTPDQYAVAVLNNILGIGGFSSRLMREVRSNQGLAYAVWGYVGRGRDRGLFTLAAETKTESAPAAVEAIIQTVRQTVAGPITREELELQKEALINSFIFEYQSRFQIVSQQAQLELLGYPEDYLATYPQRIAAVTLEEVQQAAKARMNPERLVVVAVGPAAALEKPLARFGPVRTAPLAPVR